MNAIELRKQELNNCRPEPTLDAVAIDTFWDSQLAESEGRPLCVRMIPEATPYPGMVVSKVSYRGYGETDIHAWYIRPASATAQEELPCIVTFPGYTGDRGYPERYARYILLGYSVLAVDVRGQLGETGNLLPLEQGVVRGWITQGLLEKEHSYYLAVAMDTVRAIEAAAELPGTDPARIAITGASQGGGIALLAGALSRRVAAVAADIPNLCRLDFGVMNSTSSLTEIAEYLKRYPEQLEQVLHNLAYFDIVNLAHRFTAPVLMSSGWKDTVCMPETIYAAYNRIQAPKQMQDYPFSGHEVGEFQQRVTARFLQEQLDSSR
ncbi:acetylxylan esterase [Paenibacillus sp. MMS20-IR301]|uniref:acetylxylan esterase n=1 Tax=Paenibacillus sp. MMS20-IR301 TaxID=2895946 RepID=UPI0028E67929|nr:acetylxylan esterase [Paenibacillus sp. MMS20-IR301]WNS45942.1 acetylxylan esterase [Paenibacillus sp. MMS20-IR301]